MENKSQLTMYTIAHQLAMNHGFDVLYMNNNVQEIWLEKVVDKTSRIVRISTIGFDWKNHLKKDVAIVFQKTKAMKKLLQGKHVEVHNVYISPHSPVDSWEILKKPMIVQEKNPIKMNVYYLSGEEWDSEQNRLEENIGIVLEENIPSQFDEELEKEIHRYKVELYQKIQEKKKREEGLFSNGKPIVTYLLIAINAILYLLLEFNGGSESNETLIEYGAKFNPLILDGEWWRVVTSMFLHIGLFHFISNMLFLYYFGSLAEKIYGSLRFFFIYMLAGIAGSVASFAFVTNLSAGASGALYGLFGAFIYFGLFHKKIFFRTIGKDILMLLGINIVLGFVLPQLDVTAHMGGLVAGFIAAGIVHFPKKRKLGIQALAFIIYAIAIYSVLMFGVTNNQTNPTYHLMNIETLIQEERYEEVIDSATKGLENPGEYESLLLFQRSYAYIKLEQINEAITDLEKSIKIMDDPSELPESYYNLALLYQEIGDERAEEMIRIAFETSPSNKQIKELYQNITGEIGD
ncbi:rhomboid family intramembrane serine protease [Ornithinibacillus scapharcae]|uniref:rhomboid family intramembrane serine protease n=1 Tax=Ornithinibacillus scapharcae TaxID=1147159 RepID=UPI000225B0FE|nr:rhomboid family intramembrane serine protease [Ornithinibacillus scapharcae]